MIFWNRFSTVGALILVSHFGTTSCLAADRYRSWDSGQPRDLINQPVCWAAEQPEDSRDCDFARKT
jgi:hypothetical protein